MEYNPLVSVIMNCFNCQKYLKEAIESVLNQSYKNLEIIFWDNQSTDNSAEIINSYKDDRIKYFYVPKFTPLGEARNLAIDKANGDWIAFLDCDDIWDLNKLNFFLEKYFISNEAEKISFIYSQTKVIDKNKNILYQISKVPSGYIHDDLLINENFIVFSSILVKKDVLNRVGKIEENLKYCEDLDLLLKLTKNNKAIGIDKYLTFYRVHTDSITNIKRYDNDIETVQFLEKYIIENRINKKIRKYIYINNSYRIGILFFKLFLNNDYKNILSLLFNKYFLLFPFSFIYKRVLINE